MAEVVPEPVRVQVHAALLAAAGDHLVDVGGGQRLPVARAQPQLRPPGLRVPGPGADVPVQAPGCLVADPDDPGRTCARRRPGPGHPAAAPRWSRCPARARAGCRWPGWYASGPARGAACSTGSVSHRGRKGERRSMSEAGYAGLIAAAHQELHAPVISRLYGPAGAAAALVMSSPGAARSSRTGCPASPARPSARRSPVSRLPP